LIDVCEPWEAYSAAQFCRDAIKLIESIQARGSVPLLVGGTMLYFNALQHGLSELPAADEVVRTELLEEAKLKGWSSLHEQLCRLDPVAGKRIHPNDPQRIQRALEVFRISGNTLTELQARKRSFLAKPPCKLAMVPVHRHWLHQRIDQRFEQMIELGFLDEVSELRKDSRMLQELPAVRSVGYRQAWQHLEQQASARESEPDGRDWQDKAKAATRQLAKRQLTWLRGMDDIKVVDCGEGIAQSQQLTQAQSHLQSGWTGV